MNKEYWFTLESYVHIASKRDALLLYNSLTGKTLEYSGKEERKILHLVKKMQSPGNLRVIRLTQDELEDPAIARFVSNTRKHFMGDLIDTSYSKRRPVQLVPILNIKKGVKFLKKDASRSVGEDVMDYLTEVFLYINNRCPQNCSICNSAYRQFPCCTRRKNRHRDMDRAKINVLLEELKSTSLTCLNILGGNIFTHPDWAELMEIFNRHPFQKIVYSHYLNISEETKDRSKAKTILKPIGTGSSLLKILVNFPVQKDKLKYVLETVDTVALPSRVVFIVRSEEEFAEAESLILSSQIDNHCFQPLFNGTNLEFFKQNVFLDKDDILQAKPTLKEIFQNSVVNKLNFGRLTVFHNGDIYANVNAPRLGVLGKDSLFDLLFKEMYHGKSWRRIRKSVIPCKSCTFEALCPPLSNYNHALARNNLCHLWRDAADTQRETGDPDILT